MGRCGKKSDNYYPNVPTSPSGLTSRDRLESRIVLWSFERRDFFKSKRGNMDFRNVTRTEVLALALLIVVSVASRFFIETPNFKPIAAFALFGGFMLRKPSLAIMALLAALTLSDWRIGYYPWPLMTCVYLSLTLSVMLGVGIRRHSGGTKIGWQTLLGFGCASLAMSTSFYLLTNGAVWWMGNGYSPTLLGLLECYAAGLPFYRWTVTGDLFFTFATLGSYLAFSYLTLKSRTGKQVERAQLETSLA